jgi:ATP-binding cassette subfamily B protein
VGHGSREVAVSARRSFLVPEIVQASAMDCGPAALASLLGGFGLEASYGRLREACQTSVDGTSIDTLEDVARQLGLDAEQVMVPVDHLMLGEGSVLPGIVVVRMAHGLTHFVVAWRRHGPLVQVMDPGTGRRWPSARRFREEIHVHEMPVPAAGWREWAGSSAFTSALRRRLLEAHASRAPPPIG